MPTKRNPLEEYLDKRVLPGREGEIGLGRPAGENLRDPKTIDHFNLDKYLQDQLGYEFPEEELNRRLQSLGISMAGAQTQAQRSFDQNQAARTGGRLGSAARGTEQIGGQYALARAAGTSQIMSQAFNQQIQQRMAALNAYIQKYGIDKQAQLAMEQLEAQREQASAEWFGDIFGSLALLPFLFSGGGGANTIANDTLALNFNPTDLANYEDLA